MKSKPTQKKPQTPQANEVEPGLYLVATPIGNLRDITLRALDVLDGCDLVVCEDTRVTGKLLRAYGLQKKMMPYNDHNAPKQRPPIFKALEGGQRVAFVSDAGMPLIADPGYKLAREAVAKGIPVTSVPGPNAALAGLQLSALPTDAFTFIGFLPPKSAARKKVLEQWAQVPGTLIAYETGPRLADSLRDMEAVLGERTAAVARELTKLHEEVRRGKLSDLAAQYKDEDDPKGEIVVVIGQAGEVSFSLESIEDQLKTALQTLSVRDAAESVSVATGKPRKAIYTLALKLAGRP